MSDGDDSRTHLGDPLTPTDQLHVKLVIANQNAAVALTQVAETVQDVRDLVQPAIRWTVAAAAAQTAAWNTCAGVGHALEVLLQALADLLRGWWGGPVLTLTIVLIAALALASTGWSPRDVDAFASHTIRAARCGDDAGEPLPPAPTP